MIWAFWAPTFYYLCCSGVMYWCDLLEAELSLPGGFQTRFLARSSAKSRSRGGSNRYLDV